MTSDQMLDFRYKKKEIVVWFYGYEMVGFVIE